MTKATLTSGVTAVYTYDGEGKRVKKSITQGGVTTVTRFIYDGTGKLIAEYEGVAVKPDVPTREYISGPTGLLAIVEGGGIKYLTPDHLGTPRVVTDGTGKVVSRHDYYPFGEEIGAGIGGRTDGMGFSVDDKVRQKFTGYERDTETGLDFAQARYYGSGMGRFVSADPFGASGKITNPQTFNRYVYCLNNPLRYVDPEGLDYKDLSEKQKILIDDWAKRQNEKNKPNISAETLYNGLDESQRSTYEGVTNALENTTITGKDGKTINALNTIQSVDVIAGEIEGKGGADQFRLFVTFAPGVKEFIMDAQNFYGVPGHGDEYPDSRQLRGGEPSIQFSMSRDGKRADIDVDYESKNPITNIFNGFKHLKASNSDVRADDHFEKHNKRFASRPGQTPLSKKYDPKPKTPKK